MLAVFLLEASGPIRLTPVNTMKTLAAMPLLLAVTLVQAGEPPPVGAADMLRLPQQLASQTKAIMQEREAGLKKLSDAGAEPSANDPDAERSAVDETESSGRQHQPADEAITR